MFLNRELLYEPQPEIENSPSFDRKHFERQTFGDRNLQREIIGLFLAQVAGSRSTLLEPMTNTSWRYLTHTLKGAAGAVGATQFAILAGQWELAGSPRDADARLALVQVFEVEQAAFAKAAQSYLE